MRNLLAAAYWTWKAWKPRQSLTCVWGAAWRFVTQRQAFRAALRGGEGTKWVNRPALTDLTRTTPFDAHYLYQAVWASAALRALNPPEHVDVGSDLRWIALEQVWRRVVFVDIRPPELELPQLTCLTGSLLSLPFPNGSVASLSCLHVIEHVGLGRYGDPLDPEGDRQAATELIRVLAPGGQLLLATPVGQPQICFNSHRVYAPEMILALFAPLRLVEFSLVDDQGRFLRDATLAEGGSQRYGCGMFRFQHVGVVPPTPSQTR